MAKQYRRTPVLRIVDFFTGWSVRLGVGPKRLHLLTVRGRRSGRPYTTPAYVTEFRGSRWVVSPYGPGGWAANARATGEVLIRRGRRREQHRVTEVEGSAAVPVLREYVRQTPFVRPYFDVVSESPDAAWLEEAPRHPVFRLEDGQ